MTGLSAIVFAIVDPQKPLSPDHNSSTTQGKVGLINPSHSDSVVYIFRSIDLYHSFSGLGLIYLFSICGVAAFVTFILCWRLAREIRNR